MKFNSSIIPLFVTAISLGACGGDDAESTDTASGTDTTVTTSGDTPGMPTSTVAPSTDDMATTTADAPTTTADAPTTTDDAPTTTGEEPETTQIRVVHLSPGAPAVDIFANGDGSAPAIDGLAVRNSATVTVPAGAYEFAIAADGSPIEQAVFTVPSLNYEAGKVYTVVALGKLADNTFDIIRIENDPAGLDPAQLRLHVTHAASAAAFAEVDVWAGPAVDALGELIPDFQFKSSATADVPPADLTIGLDADNDGVPDAVWAIPGAALAPGVGAVVNVFAYSDDGDAPSLQVVAGDGPTIQLDPV